MKFRQTMATANGTRKYNQDRASVLEGDSSVLLILADGLGGHAGGDVAADILVDTASKAFLKVRTPVIEEPSLFLALILQHAHREINNYAKSSSEDIDPRTTAVLCLVQNGYAYWAHAGDSRLYLFRNGSQLTRTLDHTGSDQAKSRPGRKSSSRGGLYNCIGGPLRPRISLGPEIALQYDDRIMLCSDGVWQGMRTDEIVEYLYREDLEDAMEDMLEKIEERHRDKCDNITVVAFAYDDTAGPGKSLRHEHIRELSADDLWRAARDAERSLRSGKRGEGAAAAPVSQAPGSDPADDLEAILNEVESFVKRWEER